MTYYLVWWPSDSEETLESQLMAICLNQSDADSEVKIIQYSQPESQPYISVEKTREDGAII